MSAADDLLNRANNKATGSTVAGPRGLPSAGSAAQQLAARPAQQQQQGGGSAADQLLGSRGGSFVAQQGTDMTGTLREWYTGRNTDGTDNGWNTEFQKRFQDGYDSALRQGNVWEYYKRPDATGVVLWDNARGRQGTLNFGDVVVDGSKVGNVYDDFDRHTANLMMGEYVVKTGQRKAELNEAGNTPETIAKAWDEEISRERGVNTQQAEVAPRAEKLKEDVRTELETDDDRAGVVATAFGGGAVLGGGLGTVIAGPVGTVVGGLAGGTISAIGAWLNSDSLTYQLAMSQEKQKLAAKEGAGIASELSLLSQNFSSIALNPLQNWIAGTYDAKEAGGVGGGSLGGEYNEVDAEGNRKAGVVWQALGMAAMFGDSALQLASPAGRLAYQAQMTAQISSGVIGLLPGQGQWDDTLLKQNSVWTSEAYNPETGKMESHVDVGNALAGVGTVAIDAVQLGGISSLSRGVDRLAAQTAKATGQEAAGWAKGLQRWNPANFTERINLSSAQRLAVKEGAEIETRSGYKFVVKDDGEIVGPAKKTLAMLAPSEGLQALTAKALARRDRAWRDGGVRAEDLYNTASQLAMGTKGLTSILVNATGEAQEEVAQAILEPMSQDHAIDSETVFRAALAGAFSGGGMTLGARFGMPSQDQRMYATAALGHMQQTNGAVLKYEDWQQMTDLQKRTAVKAAGSLSKAVTDGAFDKIESDMVDGMVSGVAGAARARDYVRDTKEAALAKGAEATDQASPIVMHESYTFRPDALSTSHHQLLMHQQDKTRAIQVQLDAMKSKIIELTTKNKVDPADTDIATQLAEATANEAAHVAEIKASVTLERTIKKYVDEIDAAYANPDKALGLATAEAKIDELNVMLEDMFDMTANEFTLVMRDGKEAKIPLNADTQFAFSRAVSRLVTRDPADSKGSWPILAPQVNKIWASRKVNGLYGVSQIILQQIRGDYDGDKTRPLQQLVVSDQRYRDMRAGASIFGVDVMPDIGSSKYEQTLATRVMQSWDADNATLSDAARKVAADIEASLTTRYVASARGRRDDLVDRKIIADIGVAVHAALKNGQDVREIVLTMMSQRAGREILKVGLGEYWMPGQPKLSNEVYWIANMVTQHLDEFQQVYAEYTPNNMGPVPQRKAAQPKKVATDAQHRDPISGATEASNIIHELPGSNLFRMFQKLHYNLWNSTTKYVGWAHKASNPEYARLVEFYEALSQGVLKQRQERENATDTIIGDVLRMLEQMAGDKQVLDRMGLSSLGDMALIANAGVPQMVYKTDSDGVRRMEYTGRTISIGQNLLYLSIEKFKRENHKVWEKDANLSAAVNALSPLTQPQVQGTKKSRPGNAEMAFVKIFENTRVYDLVGTDAHSLGVQRTVGQVFRELINLSPSERTQQKYELRSGVYADSKKGFSIPFSEPEMKSGSVTAYKSLVDSLFSAADSSITVNRTGKNKGEVHGRYADKSDEREEEIQETWKTIQLMLRTFKPNTAKHTAQDIVDLTNSNKEFGDALLKALPDSVMPWALKRFDPATGTPVFSKWFYEVWVQETAEAAAMSYFRGLTLGKWFAMVRTLKIDAARGDKSSEKGIAYHKLDSRLHRVMFRLGANSVGNDEMLAMFEQTGDRDLTVDSTPLKAFMTKFNEFDSTKEFFKWLNLEEGMVDEGAPLLPWMDEVALFDADKTNGGWTSKQSTPALMENITNLRNTANRLIGDFNKSVERSKSDVQTGLAIQRWHRHLNDPTNTDLQVRDGDEDTYNQFLDLLKRAARRRLVSGPRAMLQHTAHLAYGIYAPAHAKANNADFLAANAALEALDNAIGYLTTPERALNDLTSHSEDSVAASPHMILRDGGTMMTRDGKQVTWAMNAVDAMLPLMLDDKQHPLMRTMLFDTVVELDSDNVARKKFLMGATLDTVLKGNTAKKLYRQKKNPDLTQAMKWLTLLEAELRQEDKHVIERKVTELVLARTTALDHPADFEEIQAMTTKAYIDFAVATQAASMTVERPGQDDPAHVAGRALRQAALMAQVAATYKMDPALLGDDMAKARLLIEDERIAPYRERVRELRKQAQDPAFTGDRGAVIALMESQQAVMDAMQAKIDRMFDLDVVDQIVAQYQYDPKADQAFKTARQNVLMKYVYEHGELVKAAGPALQTVTQIMNHLGETPQNQLLEPLMLGEKAWTELSNVIISVEIGHLLTVGPADTPFPPYPTDENLQKYWDPSFSWLTDFLLPDDKSGIVAAARRIAKEAGKVTQEVTAAELVTKVKNTLLRQGTLGALTPEIPIQAIESYELLTGASAVPSVSMHGLLSQRWGAVMKATSRQETDTVADASVELSWRDLDWVRNGQFNDITINAGNGESYTRPLAHLNNRFAEELSFTYGSATTPVDLMQFPNVAREWIRSNGTAPTSRFKSVNIDRLRDEIGRILTEMYPSAKPEVLDQMLAAVKVTMKFVNPDAQPASTQEEAAAHSNSLWHEGTVYESAGDTGPSLIEAYFFGPGGVNPRGQQSALDTRKLGLMGIEDYVRPTAEEVQAFEAYAGTDFGRMLAEKTKHFLDVKIGNNEPTSVHFYNAIYKLMKLKHWLEGTDPATGKRVRWSAEQVIDWQMKNPGVDIFGDQGPLRAAVFWKPADPVLADMMGDIGYGGVSGRLLQRDAETDLNTIPRYKAWWSDLMEERFPVARSQPTHLTNTDVAQQSYVQDLTVSSYTTPQERTAFKRRWENMQYKTAAALEDRRTDMQRKTFDPVANRAANQATAVGYVSTQDVRLNMPDEWKFMATSHAPLKDQVTALLQTYTAEQQARAGAPGTSFWIFSEDGTSDTEAGLIMKGNLGGKLRIVPGEIVAFDVSGYDDMDPEQARRIAEKRIKWFVDRGAALMIVSSKGKSPLIAELQESTQVDHGYQPYENNNLILIPDVFDESVFQNVAAARSRLTAPSAIPISQQRLSFLFFDQQVEENTMWVPVRPGYRSKFDSVQAIFDLLPIDAHSQFNTAVTHDAALAVQNRLAGLGTAGKDMVLKQSLAHLYDESGKLKKGVRQQQLDKETQDFNDAWDRMVAAMPDRVEKNTSGPIPGEEFGTGDFIPLIGRNNQLMLYRHGYKYPNNVTEQLRNQTQGDTDARGLVVYSGEIEPTATTHRGTVSRILKAPGRGFRMELEIPVGTLGSKLTFEHNGMKYMRTNMPGRIVVPELAVFGNKEIDGYASMHDVMSKQATGGLGVGFAPWFAMVGIDFTEDVRTFFGQKNTSDAIGILRQIAALGKKMSVEEIHLYQSLTTGQDAYLSLISDMIPSLGIADVDISKWVGKLQDETAEAAIVRAMIVYLMSPGANVDAILSSTGFNVDRPHLSGATTQMMPELFTRAFDLSAPDSVIRAELSQRLNHQLNEDSNSGESWHLDVNTWEVTGKPKDGPPIRGMLQFGEAVVSDDNTELNLQAQERKDVQSATTHQALMNMVGTGGTIIPTRAMKKLNRLTDILQQDLPTEAEPGALWRDLTFVNPTTSGPGSRWQNRNVAEHKYYNRSLVRMGQYRHAISFKGDEFDEDREAINTQIKTVRHRLNLRPAQEELVHYWIRQMLYHPVEGKDQNAFTGDLSPKDVLGAAKAILANLDQGKLPTYNAAGPGFLSYTDLSILYQAAQGDERAWRPSRKENEPLTRVSQTDIGEWIAVAFGQALDERTDFDPIYRLDFSGFMNTYQTVLKNTGYLLNISFDKQVQSRLLDPKTNELLTVTIDRVEETRLTEQVILATANLEYEDLMNGNSDATNAAWRQRRLDARARWRSRNAVPPIKTRSSRDYVRYGTERLNKDADQHSLQRIVIALRHGTAMLNPGLYFSMIPEQGFRMFLSEMTNLLTGESTLRTTSFLERRANDVLGKVTGGRAQMSLTQYSPDQIGDLNNLFTSLGNDGAFTALIIKDMMYQKNRHAPNKAVAGFEKYAAIGNWWQDPTHGTTQKSLARHYVEAILRANEAMPGRRVMTVDSVIAALRTDPAYFAKHDADLHKMASNWVVDFRSLKQTPWSLAMKGIYDPWSKSANMPKRFVGTLLKMQLMYATYNLNVLTTITGMQGYSDMAAVFLDGKRNPKSWLSTWWKARNDEPISDEDYKTIDMSSAIDGATIANAFIRGGVTQTGLFLLGMAAGGVLSGEDDETKRRRKLAQAQNVPLLMDPRRLENDFRNKDTIFLDWMPPQFQAFFRVQGDDGVQGARAAAQVSWILKPFLSPILGMEKFFMTGDFSYVTHGFMDAVGSMPLFNLSTWDDTVRASDELVAMAADQQEVGTTTATKNATYLLTSAVAMYEHMLVENMFVNSLYSGFDQYDRDPTKLVLRDSDGDIQKTIEDNARPNDVATKDYIADGQGAVAAGDVGTGYMKRDPLSAAMAAYTENNLTAAAVLSLFKPIHHQEFFRGDMPTTMRNVKLPEMSDTESKVAIIVATLNQQASQGTLERQLSLDEVTYMLKGKFMKEKDWNSFNNLDALAKQFYESDRNPVYDPLSILGKDGQEVLSKSGQAALFKGLMHGTISLDDPEMRGIFITVDQRKEIEKDFFTDYTRQGVDMGLSHAQAEKRAARLMYGPSDNSQIMGFKEMLYDKRIPTSPNAQYKQLNTTYVTGPDGFPWATGYKRGGAPFAGGFWSLFGGLKRPTIGVDDSMSQDSRMNSVDNVRGIDTGLRGLVPVSPTENIPTDYELTKMQIKAIDDAARNAQKAYTPNEQDTAGSGGRFYRSSYGGGFRRFGGGGGGGGGYSPTIYWSRQPTLPRGTNVFGNSAKNLFWNNANIRRTTIRRERYESSRGRLNQWQ